MSFKELLQVTVKKTTLRVDKIPFWYYFILGSVVSAILISVSSFLFSPFLESIPTNSLIASITVFAMGLSAIFLMLSFCLVVTVVFFSILLQEQRREREENAYIIATKLKETIREVLNEIDPNKFDLTDETTKNALNLANRSYQEQKAQITSLKTQMDNYEKNEERYLPIIGRLMRKIFELNAELKKK